MHAYKHFCLMISLWFMYNVYSDIEFSIEFTLIDILSIISKSIPKRIADGLNRIQYFIKKNLQTESKKAKKRQKHQQTLNLALYRNIVWFVVCLKCWYICMSIPSNKPLILNSHCDCVASNHLRTNILIDLHTKKEAFFSGFPILFILYIKPKTATISTSNNGYLENIESSFCVCLFFSL